MSTNPKVSPWRTSLNRRNPCVKTRLELRRSIASSSQSLRTEATYHEIVCRWEASRVVGLGCQIRSSKTLSNFEGHDSMILETGQALDCTPNGKLLASRMKDHGNAVFKSLLKSRSIAQASKLPGGNIRVMVTTEDACHELECQLANIPGAK
uniref:AlNc14C25G2523 protein n=1 Tax=Albugo laibachii Nc14 TaxID=890382 RepID=F0W6N5_9STRA|nr:AlNc14C25G2523 [Albugo laibachii Nc14]|eukprot:CCA16780.1 AlNc14C25G2523 [Albugo laibachii Nc14]